MQYKMAKNEWLKIGRKTGWLSKDASRPRSDGLVIFGISGDLAKKQIFSALHGLARDGKLNGPVIGFAKENLSKKQLVEMMRSNVEGAKDDIVDSIAERLQYISGDVEDPKSFAKLKSLMRGCNHPLIYLALPPQAFKPTILSLKGSGCNRGARLVIEKPFGEDRKSARELNKVVHSAFDEADVFRMDHFLGKDGVRSILDIRFDEPDLDRFWSSKNIKSIEISMIEDFGIRGRGKFYDSTGCIKDVVQNHLMQVLCFLCMESYGSGDSIRDKKSDLLSRVTAIESENLVTGQFVGYLKEPGVEPSSTTETYAAMKLSVQNERWRGTSFHMRSGKSMPMTSTEVAIRMSEIPDIKWPSNCTIEKGLLRIQLETDQKIPTYERLFDMAMDGDATFFSRKDEVDHQWRIFENVIGKKAETPKYKPGTWGPESSKVGPEEGWTEPLNPERK
jgi:glucose-6-phosphate 1-dehydrogenase